MAGSDFVRVAVSQWVLVSLAATVLAIRYILRLTRMKRVMIDDHVLALAWTCMIISVSLVTVANKKSKGVPLPFLGIPLRIEVGKLNIVAGPFVIAAAMLSKTSFALTLLRVVSGRMRIALWLIIATMNMALFLSIVLLLAACRPVAKNWNPTLSGTCMSQHVTVGFGLFASAYSCVMDFVLAGIACWVIWGVRIQLREKIGVAVGMSMGIFAGITGAIKCVYLSRLDFPNIYIWDAAEVSVTIIAASIPILRVFVVEKARQHTSGRTGSTSNGADIPMSFQKAKPRGHDFRRIDFEEMEYGEDDGDIAKGAAPSTAKTGYHKERELVR